MCASIYVSHSLRLCYSLRLITLDKILIFTGVSSLGRYVFGSEISYNKAPPRLPGLGC
jgi:hypothetical protein